MKELEEGGFEDISRHFPNNGVSVHRGDGHNYIRGWGGGCHPSQIKLLDRNPSDGKLLGSVHLTPLP